MDYTAARDQLEKIIQYYSKQDIDRAARVVVAALNSVFNENGVVFTIQVRGSVCGEEICKK